MSSPARGPKARPRLTTASRMKRSLCPGARATVARLRQLYLGSVGDLDDAFGSFLEILETGDRSIEPIRNFTNVQNIVAMFLAGSV